MCWYTCGVVTCSGFAYQWRYRKKLYLCGENVTMKRKIPALSCLFLLLCSCVVCAAQRKQDTVVIIDRYRYIHQNGDTVKVDLVYPPGDRPSVNYESYKALTDSLNGTSPINGALNEADGMEAGMGNGNGSSIVILAVTSAVVLLAVALVLLRRVMIQRKRKVICEVSASEDSVQSISDLVALLMRLASEKDLSDGISPATLKRLRGFVSDKNSLLSALLASYSVTHPEFVRRLRTYGLTDMEAGYCCLYAAGLNGKDISFILNDGGHGHYNTASALRSRFGLKDRRINLSQWLKSLLAECEKVKV